MTNYPDKAIHPLTGKEVPVEYDVETLKEILDERDKMIQDKVRRIKNVLSDIEKVCGNCMYNGEPNGCNRIGGVCEMFDAVWDALDYINELEMKVKS